jgi:hypothetical protein
MFGLWLAGKGEFSGQTHRAAVVEHPYRLAMVAAGVVTWPLRRVQGALGRGDELVMVARAER